MRRLLKWVTGAWVLICFLGAGFRVLGDCASYGLPFTDLGSETTFCAAIAEAYYTGITNGTSATTFSPNGDVTRAQAAAFATRTLDAALARGNQRAALGQWWTTTPHYDVGLGLTGVGNSPRLPMSDGQDIWVPNRDDSTVSRIRASDGANLGTWDSPGADAVLAAMGKIFVPAYGSPGSLYMIDPASPPGPATMVANTIGFAPLSIAFDGNRIWIANLDGSVSIVTPGSTIPWSVTNVKFDLAELWGILFDGRNIWVTDNIGGALLKLDSEGAVLQTVSLGGGPTFPAFDGHNIWVPNGDSLQVVRASDGVVLKTFSADNGNQNGLSASVQAAFDGQRVLVTDETGGLSIFKASDLSVIGNPTTPGVNNPYGVCSDGVNFWVSFAFSASVGRF